MYLTSTLKRTLAIGGVSLLAVVGLIGWTRRGAEPVTSSTYAAPAPSNPEPVSRDPNAPVVYSTSPFGDEGPRAPASRAFAPAPASRAVSTERYSSAREPRRYVVTRKRPFSHSAAIVGGSAAGGALIGALAGGGKGAAIGALAGGGGGLAYDRLTHNKKKVVVEK